MAEVACSGVLFDLDGVLADSTAAVERHWDRFASRHGLVPSEVTKTAHGKRSIDVIAGLVSAPEVDSEAAWFERLEVLDTADVVALPGAAELLAHLPRERWGIVTSCGRELAVARLAAARLPVSKVLVSADQVASGKPDPGGYLLGIAQLGCDPVTTVVFEDAPSGVEAGRRAGATVVGLTTTHAANELFVDHLVADLGEVKVASSEGLLRLILNSRDGRS